MIDCFPFFNELDLLEIRLNSLAPYVDRFILSECPVTHTGKPKPLYFEENKDRFKNFNITHLIVKGYEKFIGMNAWNLEKYQREYLMNGINGISSDAMILLSDVDEIPDLSNYDGKTEGLFMQKLYYYYLNTYTGRRNWHGTLVRTRKNIRTLTGMRNKRMRTPAIGTGWHFSTLGPPEQIIYKIESFAHEELNTTERKNMIAENMKNLVDPYNRAWGKNPRPKLVVEMPSGPEWLLKNKDKYKHLFYEN